MHDFMDINQLSKEFLDNFRKSKEIIDGDSPSGRAVKVQFNSKLFKKVKICCCIESCFKFKMSIVIIKYI